MTVDRSDDLIALTADIVAALVANNEVGLDDLPELIAGVHRVLGSLGEAGPGQPPASPQEPAVPIRSSIKPDHIVCLEDGRKLKMLKRYLMARYGLTPAEYRAKWNLPADYPMVAPNYSATRQALAQQIGLGRKTGDEAPVAEVPPAPTETPAPAPAPAPAAPSGRTLLKPRFTASIEMPAPPVSALQEATDEANTSSGPVDILREAINRRRCVTAIYNKKSVTLAPHAVYTKHGEPFLRAVTVEHDGKRPRELKLGTFKLTGLGTLAETGRPLVRFPGYQPEDAEYAESMVCALP